MGLPAPFDATKQLQYHAWEACLLLSTKAANKVVIPGSDQRLRCTDGCPLLRGFVKWGSTVACHQVVRYGSSKSLTL